MPLPTYLVLPMQITAIIGALCSIGISSWQFQSSSEDYFGYGSFKDNVCDKFPYDYLRPFHIKFDGSDADFYCGFSDINTGFRLSIAILTILFLGFLLYLKRIRESDQPGFMTRMFHKFSVSFQILLWYAALVLDSAAIGTGQLACDESFSDDNSDCSGTSTYGVSIAVDLICLVPLILITLCENEQAEKTPLASTSSRV